MMFMLVPYLGECLRCFRWIAIYGIIVTVLVSPLPTGMASATASLDHGDLVITDWEDQWPEVEQGAVLKKTFTVRNSGSDASLIRGARANCGCVKIEIEKKELAPGETANMTLVYDSSREYDETVVTLVIVYSAEGSDDLRLATYKARVPVITVFRLVPRQLSFGTVRQFSECEAQMTLACKTNKTVALSGFLLAKGMRLLRLTPVEGVDIGPHTGMSKALDFYMLTAKAVFESCGRVQSEVVMEYYDGKGAAKTLTVPVFATVLPDVVVEPGRLFLGSIRLAESSVIRKELSLKSFSCRDVVVESVAFRGLRDGTHSDYEILETGDGTATLRVELTFPSDEVGALVGTISINYAGAHNVILDVPIVAVFVN